MLEIRNPAVSRVWAYARELGIPPEPHLARWVECTALVKKGRDPEEARGMVKRVEVMFEGEQVVGVKAYV